MRFFEVFAIMMSIVAGWVSMIYDSGPVETLVGFGVMSVVFALLAIAYAIKEHGEKIQRGANPP